MVFGQYLAACLTLTVASFSTPGPERCCPPRPANVSCFRTPGTARDSGSEDPSLGTVAAFTEPNSSNATAMQLNVTMQQMSEEDAIFYILELVCGHHFNAMMSEIGSDQWCNWAAVASFYSTLTMCTETLLLQQNLFWPNEVGERFFIKKHSDFFQWCHREPGELLADPANNMLLGLVMTPICIIPLMVGLVVWCSKTSDTKK